jgi:hypothetical protein
MIYLFSFILGVICALSATAFLVLWRGRGRRGPLMMGFGNRQAWRWFNEQFPEFVRRHANLESLRDKMFIRRVVPTHHADYIVYGLGRVCIEDFEQALNLCGNGFGIGAMQILRGMYERHVSAAYLAANRDDVNDFVDYHHVQQRKALTHLREAYRGDQGIFRRLVSEEEERTIEESYEALPAKFKNRCEECGKPQMMSWTPHSTAALARKGGQNLEKLYYHEYFRPTLFTHSTFTSVVARVVDKPGGSFAFESEGQQKHIREALIGAHSLLLNVFDLQNKHFQLGLDAEVERCNREYLECWAPEELANYQ